MRPWESLFALLLALAGVMLWVPAGKRRRWTRYLPVSAVLAMTVHLGAEGYRWQMVPGYLAATAAALASLPRLLHRWSSLLQAGAARKWPQRLSACAILLAAGTVVVLATLFPHLQLPAPSGPFAVGTLNLYFTDQSRPETFTPNPEDHREICARAWYPAARPVTGKAAGYLENARATGRALTRYTPAPSFLFDHFALIRAHSYRGAAVLESAGKLPIILFNHAYWAGITQSTVLMEDLASRGYFVVSIGHAYETPYFVEAGGGIRGFDPYNQEFRLRGAERMAGFEAQQQISGTQDILRLQSLIRQLSGLRPKTVESVRIWARDVGSTIDELDRMNRGDGPLAGRLDMDRIGVMGHSMGGAAAGEAVLTDPRCKAGINLDGLQLGDLLDRDLTRPFMFIHHDNASAANRTPNLPFFRRAQGPAYLIVVKDTGHLSFSDFVLYGRGSFFRLTQPLGTIDGKRFTKLLADYVSAFFDCYLRGRRSPLLDGPSPEYPEVEIAVRNPQKP